MKILKLKEVVIDLSLLFVANKHRENQACYGRRVLLKLSYFKMCGLPEFLGQHASWRIVGVKILIFKVLRCEVVLHWQTKMGLPLIHIHAMWPSEKLLD